MQKKTWNVLFTFCLTIISLPDSVYTMNDLTLLEQAYNIKNVEEIRALFPKTIEDMQARFESVSSYVNALLQNILKLPAHERTFENTVLAFDQLVAFYDIYSSIISLIKMVHPNDVIREKAASLLVTMSQVGIDLFQSNRDLYRVLKEYQATTKEAFNEERSYYFSNLMENFKVAGFELEEAPFNKLQDVRKQLSHFTVQFQSNIAQDKSTICFTKDELAGVNDDFLDTLPKTDAGYVCAGDYLTHAQIMSHGSSEATRKKYYQLFKSRAYPANIEMLHNIINARDELANILGYQSYADLDLMPTMAQWVEQVETFLSDLYAKVRDQVKESWKIVMSDLPEGVTLTKDGKMKPWDVSYIMEHYLKTKANIDDIKVAEYFPMEKTIRGLLDIYERFFNLNFQVIKCGDLWDPSVQTIEVKTHDNELIGYIIVDLFPRANKYTHACCLSVIPPITYDRGKTYSPAMAVVIANFSKPTQTKPSLLKHHEVKTFFHEFGHAIHALVGRSEMPTKAAYATKFDFVETPSQLLEEWIWEPEILQNLSNHYITGESLPQDMLERLIQTREIQQKISLGSNIIYAKLCLRLYQAGKDKDLVGIKKDVYQEATHMIDYDYDVHNLCAFTHLSGYGPKYYTYVWSQQLAKQIFDYIKSKNGLLNPEIGQRYIAKIIGRGGSCHPTKMIEDFLSDES